MQSGSGLRILGEAPEDNTIELKGVAGLLGPGLLDHFGPFELVSAFERTLQSTEFIDETTKCPNISFSTANPLLYLFRRDVECVGKYSGS